MSGQPSKEELIQHFQLLCNQQRQLQTKLAEIRMEKGEHEIVAETLKNVSADRKCWRLVGGVLTERNVGDVLPALENQVTGLANVMTSLEQQMNLKAKEITAYREKHNIMIKGQAPPGAAQAAAKQQGVLVQ
ncbi:Oidioi.mRNA.OKI2018_I69.chr2.g7793.t1.cds [Oikopleura dioica]|uniref:Oidioi.mRNA.OKI2018_I69.chr2.g7793.t1.cds n=1 Tax=Oikopleura dioica TaxID=34765 RepID=A0ABN7T7U9_OIKDI|nr:Oidioi.mRNA.OKI2018_I69.chr2.g7793.t1.cds [Oikopleura dioica]